MTELERAALDFAAKNKMEHYVWTWKGMTFTLQDLLAAYGAKWRAEAFLEAADIAEARATELNMGLRDFAAILRPLGERGSEP